MKIDSTARRIHSFLPSKTFSDSVEGVNMVMTLTYRFDYYITPGYYFLTGTQVLRSVFPSLIS